MPYYFFFILSTTFIAAGDVLAKKWVASSSFHYVVWALACYLGGSITYMPILRAKGLILSTLLWVLGTLFVGSLIGVWYGEALTRAQLVGMALGIASIVLICL